MILYFPASTLTKESWVLIAVGVSLLEGSLSAPGQGIFLHLFAFAETWTPPPSHSTQLQG